MAQEATAPKALDMVTHVLTSAALWWATAALAALGIAIFVLLRHFRSHHLRSKVVYDLLPTTTFDTTSQAVDGFAHQLGRVRPVHGWVPRPAVGVRVRFRTDDLGKLIMSVEGRKSTAGVLNKSPYPQVEVIRNKEAETRRRGELSPQRRRGRGEVSPDANRGEATSMSEGGTAS